MDSDVAIEARQVSKKYCRSLRRSMIYGLRDVARNSVGLHSNSGVLRSDEFWALDDVTFDVDRGEAIGIIGPNGSGKTTLMKLLNGIFWPDRGKIAVRGKVGALIEVGAGFHPMLSGRENIFVNAAILGMRKSDVDERLDEIIDFADIGDFIDAPVKTYSSGMFVRLGFAVAVHCNPDVLLVDEILAVGDRNFQMKCFKRMHELKNDSKTSIVLVTHNEYAIREYTHKCIVLSRGRTTFIGESEEAISHYVNAQLSGRSPAGLSSSVEGKGRLDGPAEELMTRYVPTSGRSIADVVFRDDEMHQICSVETGQRIHIDIGYETKRIIDSPIFGISFYNEEGLVTGFWNSYEGVVLPNIRDRGLVRVTVDPFDLPIGRYHVSIVLCEREESNVLEWSDLDRPFEVLRPLNTRGSLRLRQKWEMASQ